MLRKTGFLISRQSAGDTGGSQRLPYIPFTMHWFCSANLFTTSTGRLVLPDFFHLSLYQVQSEEIICMFQNVVLQKLCGTMLKILYLVQPAQRSFPPLPYLDGVYQPMKQFFLFLFSP